MFNIYNIKCQVKKLINGNDVYICDECVKLCYDILNQDKANPVNTKFTPVTIKNYLDERVIGQDQAKIILSVAIYNHMQRIANPIIDGIEIEKSPEQRAKSNARTAMMSGKRERYRATVATVARQKAAEKVHSRSK